MSDISDIEDGDFAGFQNDHADQVLLLVFHASWCAPCRAMAPAVEDVAADYAGTVAVARISIETALSVTAQFGVQSVPTLVIVKNSVELARASGSLSRTRLAMMLDRTLEGARP